MPTRACGRSPWTSSQLAHEAISKYAAPGISERPCTTWSHRNDRRGLSILHRIRSSPVVGAETSSSSKRRGAMTGQKRRLLHTGGCVDGSSRTPPLMSACAFVPMNANELTPPMRSDALEKGSPTFPRGTCALPGCESSALDTYAFIVCRCRSAISFRPSSSSSRRSMPSEPAAGSVCPTLDLTVPRCSARGASAPISTAATAPISIGSPRGVPVPCICSEPISHAETPAPRIALWMARCCEGPFGAVKLLDRPSWFTAQPWNSMPSTETPADDTS